MAMFDRFRNLGRRGRRLGIELGREIAVADIGGDNVVRATARAVNPGVSGEELGSWLKRWLPSTGISPAPASLVITEGDVHHYLVDMPEMPDAERHLAAGAELRKLSPVPAAQLVYGSLAAGNVDDRGTPKQRVLVAAVDKATMRQAVDAAQSAGIKVEAVTTVPQALVSLLRGDLAGRGGNAIAYLAAGRCYLVVAQDGVVELVRDFNLRGATAQDTAELARAVAAELRRSFLFFGQRAQGASVDRLSLTGSLANLGGLATELREALGIAVSTYEGGGHLVDDSPRFAAAIGGAGLARTAGASVVPPEQRAEQRIGRFLSTGRVAAGLVLVVLLGWALASYISGTLQQGRLETLQQRVSDTRAELERARERQQMRAAHLARRDLLEERAHESLLLGTLLQRVARAVPEQVALQQLQLLPLVGPEGATYWDARIDGLVLGATRSESQAVFNRFYALLDSDPVVERVGLVEPLVIGAEAARTPPAVATAVRGGVGESPEPIEPQRQPRRPGEVRIATSLDDLPPFEPNETSVGFKLLVQLKTVETGGSR